MKTGGMPNDGDLVSVKSWYMNVLTGHLTFYQCYVDFFVLIKILVICEIVS